MNAELIHWWSVPKHLGNVYRSHQEQQLPFSFSLSPPLPLFLYRSWKLSKMHLENCCFHSLCLCWGRLFVLFGFGFWGQFSSVSSHHFVWIVFTVAVEFRGMEIDFGSRSEAGQLFKPSSKLRALKSCTHTHTHMQRAREREWECIDRDRYLVGMRVFQFSRTFPLQQQLKNQPKLCTISWPVGGT